MKLCLEKIGDEIFAYLETDRHHKKVHGDREKTDPHLLDIDCRLSNHDSFFMAFDVKIPKTRKRQYANRPVRG